MGQSRHFLGLFCPDSARDLNSSVRAMGIENYPYASVHWRTGLVLHVAHGHVLASACVSGHVIELLNLDLEFLAESQQLALNRWYHLHAIKWPCPST